MLSVPIHQAKGQLSELIRAAEQGEQVVLTRHGKPHEFHLYPGAGHAFMNEARPSYRPEAARDAWQKCLDFLARHLKG